MMEAARATDLPNEWWDALAEGEPVLGGSPQRPVIQSWTWTDHQADDCLALPPLCFADESHAGGDAPRLSPLVPQRIDDLYLATPLQGVPVQLTPRAAFKDSFALTRTPVDSCKETLKRSISPRNSGQSNNDSSQTVTLSGVVIDIQADDQSNSVTCTITTDLDEARRGQADSGLDSPGVRDLTAPKSPTLCCGNHETKSGLSEHEGDSASPGTGLSMELDLQCKGEQLALDCEEDSGLETGGMWASPAVEGRLDFIPVTQAIQSDCQIAHGLLRHGPVSSKEGSAETEDPQSSTPEPGKDMISPASPAEEGSDSPAASNRDSTASEETTLLLGMDGKRQGAKASKMVEVASVNDMSTAGVASQRRRPGRQSKNAAAAEPKTPAAKRKRSMTCKPAAPAVSGQACTQCLTHITPVWRAGPEGPKTLCNACGVRYMKVAKRK